MTSGDKQFRILTPCNRDRDSLDGTGARRWCPDCRKTVYDFALMRRAEIDAVCGSGSACGILAHQADGSLKTADPVTVPSMLRRRFLEWGAAMIVSARLAFAQQLKLPVLPEGKGGIRGVIADPQGSPIPRARVYVGGTATYTDELGRFVLAPLEVAGAVKVVAEPMGFQRAYSPAAVRGGLYTDLGTIKVAVGALVGDVIVIEPRPSASPSGSVEGHLAAIAPGDSTADLWVRLVPAAGNNSASAELRTRASSDGRFRFEKVAPADYELIVEGLGWKTHRASIKAGPAALHLDKIVMRHE